MKQLHIKFNKCHIYPCTSLFIQKINLKKLLLTLHLSFTLLRPTPRIPLPCRRPPWSHPPPSRPQTSRPQPSRPPVTRPPVSRPPPQSHTTARSTASGHANVHRWPPPVRQASASWWTAATAARRVPARWARCATRQTRATTTRDCTATTARTSLGTKKECVHVSVSHGNQQKKNKPEQLSHSRECPLFFCHIRLQQTHSDSFVLH